MHLTVVVIQKLSNSAAHDMCNMMLARVNAVLAARSPEGLCKQGLTLLSGNHFSRAAHAFDAGSVSGNTRCMAELSWMLCNGRLGVKKDEARAFKLATLGVQRNCHHCMAALSKCLADGCGCEQDFKCSLRLAHQSAEAGSRLGQYMLGQLNYDSNAHISAKYNRSQNPGMSIRVAIRNFSLAAAQGLPSASCMLGFLKEYGCTEFPADHSEAIRLYSTAAAHGDGRALYRLALCHERGRGVPQNVDLAKDFYIRARGAGFHADTIRSNLARLGPAPPPPKPSRLKAVLSVLSSCFPTSIFKWLRATCPVAGPTFLLLACIVASCAAGSILHDYRTENVLFFSMVTLGFSFAFEELWRS
jgi:TPR repeat protein